MRNLPTRVRNSNTIILFFFLFGCKGNFLFSFHTFLFPSLALKILSLYVTSTNVFSLSLNLGGFIHELSSEDTTICLSRLAHIGKNSC